MLKVVGASWTQIRISTWIIGVVIVLGIVAIILGETGTSNEDGNYSATVFWNEEQGFRIEFWGQGKDFTQVPRGVARAHYRPHINTTGWATLEIETQPEFPDWVQAFAAGIAEGSLSWQLIHWHWRNTVRGSCDGREDYCTRVRDFLNQNWDWVVEEAKQRDSEPYWHQVNLFYMQLDGLQHGFNMGVRRSRQDVEEIPLTDFLWMNAASDLVDLQRKFHGPRGANLARRRSPKMVNSLLLRRLRPRSVEAAATGRPRDSPDTNTRFDCGYEDLTLSSAFIKLVADEGQMYVAHNSAGMYSAMLKVMKRYSFGYHTTALPHQPPVPGQSLSFSSYPAAVHSMDDFYVVSNTTTGLQLVVTGTAITVFNEALWQEVVPVGRVLAGPRVVAANRLAAGGGAWADIAMRLNSGTGNKEWVVANLGLFEGTAVTRQEAEGYLERLRGLRDLLWVVEQIPGGYAAGDQSEVLKNKTYWASYGLPFYKNISELSGLAAMQTAHGDTFSYEKTALASIFHRDQANATSLAAVMRLMRSNSYKIDPLTNGNPRCAVGSRGDIRAAAVVPEPVGTTDLKVFRSRLPPLGRDEHAPARGFRVSLERLREEGGQLRTVAGPAFNRDRIPNEEDDDTKPFDWTDSDFSNVSHVGHPDFWSFPPLALNWS